MKKSFEHCCSTMRQNIDELRTIAYNEVFDEYSLPVVEDNASVMVINYCPWCGVKLPSGKREEWHEQLCSQGYENPLFEDDIPEPYKSAKWWRK